MNVYHSLLSFHIDKKLFFRYFQRYLGALFFAIVFTSPNLAMAENGISKSVDSVSESRQFLKKPFVQVKQPTNVIELLQNAMVALKNDYLLREDFFTEGVLGKYFGEKRKFLWLTKKPKEKAVEIMNFKEINELSEESNIGSGIQFSASLSRIEGKKISASLDFSFLGHTPRVTEKMIKDAFGDSYQEDESSMIIIHTATPVKTLKYDFSTDNYERKILFVIYKNDGYLDHVLFTEEEK